jgi:hypothetical protein
VADVANTGQPLWSAPLSPDGNWLVVSRLDFQSAILSVGPDMRPIQELETVARVAAGIRINPDGGSEPLSSEEILTLFHGLTRAAH